MPTRVVVYDSAITAMSLPGGQVYKWTRQRAMRVRTLARKKAPKRTGDLRASITSDYELAHDGTIFYVSAGIYYGVYVHEGTDGNFGNHPLRGRPGQASGGYWRPGMQATLAGGKWPKWTRTETAGQRPQPFLTEALEEMMATLG